MMLRPLLYDCTIVPDGLAPNKMWQMKALNAKSLSTWTRCLDGSKDHNFYWNRRLNLHQLSDGNIFHKENPPLTPDPNNFSCWKRLLSAQVCFERACRVFLSKINKGAIELGPVNVDAIEYAEQQLFKKAQRDVYLEEVARLLAGESVTKASSIYKHSPCIDEKGLLRVKGRIDMATCVSEDVKRPIILPKKHKITELVIHSFHTTYYICTKTTILSSTKFGKDLTSRTCE